MRKNLKIRELYVGKWRMRDEGARQLVDFLLENEARAAFGRDFHL